MPPQFDIYKALGLDRKLQSPHAAALAEHKTRLRRRHACKLKRANGLVATLVGLNGCGLAAGTFGPASLGTAAAVAATFASMIYMHRNDGKARHAHRSARHSLMKFQVMTAMADDARLNAELLDERVPHPRLVRPARMAGIALDYLFSTPARY